MTLWLALAGTAILVQFVRLLVVRRPRSFDVAAAFMLPALLMWACFEARNPQASPIQLRLSVGGVHVNPGAGASAQLRIGGSVGVDDLVIDGAPSDALAARLENDKVRATLDADRPDGATILTVDGILHADSDDAAHRFRHDAARRSDLMPPTLGRSVGGE